MSASPFDLPVTFTRIWLDSSIQMMRATAELWTGFMSSAPSRSATSTASPWWMPPQQPLAANAALWPAAFAGSAWGSPWLQTPTLPAASAAGLSSLFPWLPAERAATGTNPLALWQQMWLEAASPATHRSSQAAEAPMASDIWQPIAAVYRTANGHAMAAVLRTMADVVEPRSHGFTPQHYWPTMPGARH